MDFMKKLYIVAFALPMLSSISPLQAGGILYFSNDSKTDVTVVISHQRKATKTKAAGKTHQTRVLIPAHTDNYIEVKYSDDLKKVELTSEEFGTINLKDEINSHDDINTNGGRYLIFESDGAIHAGGTR